MSLVKKALVGLVVILVLAAIALWWVTRPATATLPLEDVTGTDPVLAEPDPQWFPTINVVRPIGWPDDAVPEAAGGLVVNRFAEDLEHPRILYSLPNGDVLVTLTNRPPAPRGGGFSIRGFIEGLLFARAGADVPSPNQLVLLRDANSDGVAEARHVLRDDLASPSGIAWADDQLYVANHNAVLRFDYELGATRVTGNPTKLMDLPPGGGHWMRNILINEDATRLYVAVGSVSNIGERGMALEENRAAIHELNLETGQSRMFGAGLRNPNGLDWNPWTGELWTTVNERDMLGSDLVPDYLTNVQVGAHYGWPWVYYDEIIDERVEAPMPNYLTQYTRTPEYALGPHVAALGMKFTREGVRMGPNFGPGAFIARHGSWNRSPLAGYDVVFVAFDERGNPVGKPRQVLGSFLAGDDETFGRPTWVEWDRTGALLVSDDTAGVVWRVTAPNSAGAAAIERNSGTPLPPQQELRGDPARAFEDPPPNIQPGAF
jgi:glucose/arabinose dehydrogenase